MKIVETLSYSAVN